MALATSSGVPRRPIGIAATIVSVPGERMGVSISPGEIAFTLMPRGAKSAAISRVSERRLGGGIGGAGERMHARARDRADIDDASGCRLKLADQPARQHERREEIDLEYRLPIFQARAERGQPAAALALWRDRRIVDERAQPALLRFQPQLHLGNGADDIVGIGEIDLDVVIGACLPRAVLGK